MCSESCLRGGLLPWAASRKPTPGRHWKGVHSHPALACFCRHAATDHTHCHRPHPQDDVLHSFHCLRIYQKVFMRKRWDPYHVPDLELGAGRTFAKDTDRVPLSWDEGRSAEVGSGRPGHQPALCSQAMGSPWKTVGAENSLPTLSPAGWGLQA